MMRIKSLSGRAYRRAIEAARQEISEAWGIDYSDASDSLIEELADDKDLWFTETGKLTVPNNM